MQTIQIQINVLCQTRNLRSKSSKYLGVMNLGITNEYFLMKYEINVESKWIYGHSMSSSEIVPITK